MKIDKNKELDQANFFLVEDYDITEATTVEQLAKQTLVKMLEEMTKTEDFKKIIRKYQINLTEDDVRLVNKSMIEMLPTIETVLKTK